MNTCPWCKPDAPDDVDPLLLCRGHLAEHDGLSVAELDRMEDEQAAEYLDWVG